jgi:hypothetical protein
MNTPITTEGSKSYVKLDRLEAELKRLGYDKLPRLICKNADGRWTAIFFGHVSNAVIFKGFKWIMGYDSVKA